jgi:PHD/YefM family antitoxin component YafN of YafNO toxin-antitoxin module
MNTLTTADLQRRGIAAIEEALVFGPVHIMKHNEPAAVILQESEYQHLIKTQSSKQNPDAARWIINYKPAGTRSKEEIDRQIANERNSWDLV